MPRVFEGEVAWQGCKRRGWYGWHSGGWRGGGVLTSGRRMASRRVQGGVVMCSMECYAENSLSRAWQVPH